MEVDFKEAARAIRKVIDFACALPRRTNNHMNAECQIQQREIRRAESCQSTTSREQEPRLSPIPLPPPGVRAYRPPMLRKAPPHLEFKATCLGATLAAAPVPVSNLADASTQTNMEIPPINSKKSPEHSEKSTENS